MRKRSSWVQGQSKVAEDPRAMNQDHLQRQPGPNDYSIGGPSDFAEDVAPPDWKDEYSGGEVKRNEIGMPEMKSAAIRQAMQEEQLNRKASLACRIARSMTPTASDDVIAEQAGVLMDLSDESLVKMAHRIVEAEDEKKDDDAPPAFIQEKIDESKKESKEASAAAPAVAAPAAPVVTAQDQAPSQDEKKDEKKDQGQQSQDKQAHLNLARECLASLQSGKPIQAQHQMLALFQALGGSNTASSDQELQAQAQALMVQAQQQMAQAPRVAQAPQNPFAAQRQTLANQQQMLAQQEQAWLAQQQGQGQQQVQQQMAQMDPACGGDVQMDDGLVDAMFDLGGPIVDEATGIQMDGVPMDMSDVPSDPVLDQLLMGQGKEVQAALAAQHYAQFGGLPAPQQQQQFMPQMPQMQPAPRVASTQPARVMGTRPTGGVAQIGGHHDAGGRNEVSELTNLWMAKTPPDVSGHFRR